MEPSDSVPFEENSESLETQNTLETEVTTDVEAESVSPSNVESASTDGVDNSIDPFAFDEATSQPFIGRWNTLVTRTNWEKGRIIQEWRQSLIDANAPATAYSDEAWSRLVGSVTSQHVGRLRRVHQKFGATFESYPGLFWTHFQAAADWDDAEMWLEGAVRESWSVSKMRRQRWETLGSLPGDEPKENDVVAAEVDEDFEPALEKEPGSKGDNFDETTAGPRPDGPDFGDEEHRAENLGSDDDSEIYAEDVAESAEPPVRPFEDLGELPSDLTEAFEAFKLAIIHHKTDQWSEVSSGDVLASLDALKALVTAPSGDE